jgi:hypothetical protein
VAAPRSVARTVRTAAPSCVLVVVMRDTIPTDRSVVNG